MDLIQKWILKAKVFQKPENLNMNIQWFEVSLIVLAKKKKKKKKKNTSANFCFWWTFLRMYSTNFK